jgi:hypothetical protein
MAPYTNRVATLVRLGAIGRLLRQRAEAAFRAVFADSGTTHSPAAIRRTITRDRTTERTYPALHTVPWKQKLTTTARVLLSQTPIHDPTKQPLPKFAHQRFERYERGDDVCHWYSGASASWRDLGSTSLRLECRRPPR